MAHSVKVETKESAGLPRKFRRFSVDLPVSVRTAPAPPHWLSFCLPGRTIDVGRGGLSVRFAVPVARHLSIGQAVYLEVGPSQSPSSACIVYARVAWIQDDRVGFQFTRVLRPRQGATRRRDVHPGVLTAYQ